MDNQNVGLISPPQTPEYGFSNIESAITGVVNLVIFFLILLVILLSIVDFIRKRSWQYVWKFTLISTIAVMGSYLVGIVAKIIMVNTVFVGATSFDYAYSYDLPLVVSAYGFMLIAAVTFSYYLYRFFFKISPKFSEVFLLSFFAYGFLVPIYIFLLANQ